MAGFLDFLSPVIGGVSSIYGLIQDSNARAAAQRAQQQALQDYGSSIDQQYQNMLGNNSRTLMGAAGQGATALTNLGSNLGAANAAAGVTNSSALGGSLALGQQSTDTSLANLAAQNQYNANSLHNQGLQSLAGMRLGQANQAYGYANQDLNNSRQGFGDFLGALASSNILGNQQAVGTGNTYDPSYTQQQLGANGITDADMFTRAPEGNSTFLGTPSQMGTMVQQNLSALGGNIGRTSIPSMNGTMNQGANLGGMAGGIGNGGVGQMGTNPFYTPAPGQRRAQGWTQILNTPLGGR